MLLPHATQAVLIGADILAKWPTKAEMDAMIKVRSGYIERGVYALQKG